MVSCGLRGTLTILPKDAAIVDGTNLGIQVVKALKKPLLVLGAVWRSEDIEVFKKWLQEWFRFESELGSETRAPNTVEQDLSQSLQENDIRVLNINGPRESSAPGIHLECHLAKLRKKLRKKLIIWLANANVSVGQCCAPKIGIKRKHLYTVKWAKWLQFMCLQFFFQDGRFL